MHILIWPAGGKGVIKIDGKWKWSLAKEGLLYRMTCQDCSCHHSNISGASKPREGCVRWQSLSTTHIFTGYKNMPMSIYNLGKYIMGYSLKGKSTLNVI